MTDVGRGPTSGVARALSQLTDETSGLVRRELQAARTELMDKLEANVPAVALMGAAAVLSVLSVASSHRWLVETLQKRLPPPTAALVASLSYGTAAGAAAVVGVQWFRKAPAPLPTQTARDIRQDVGDVAAAVEHDPKAR